MKLVFKNDLKSPFIENAMNQHLQTLQQKHPDLNLAKADIVVSQDTSALHAGSGNAYNVSIRIHGGRWFKEVDLHKADQNFYVAMNSAFQALDEKLSRERRRRRDLIRSRRRELKHELKTPGVF